MAFDDGDSFDLRIPGRGRVSIRLHAVDAPETVQPVGKRARQALIDAIAERPVRVQCATSTMPADAMSVAPGRATATCHCMHCNSGLPGI